MSGHDEDRPRQYEVQFSEGAEAEIESAFDYLFMLDLGMAFEWRCGLQEAVESLNEFPQRYSPDPTTADHPEANIRLLLYRFRGAVYRVSYAISEAEDGGVARILRVRKASRE